MEPGVDLAGTLSQESDTSKDANCFQHLALMADGY